MVRNDGRAFAIQISRDSRREEKDLREIIPLVTFILPFAAVSPQFYDEQLLYLLKEFFGANSPPSFALFGPSASYLILLILCLFTQLDLSSSIFGPTSVVNIRSILYANINGD